MIIEVRKFIVPTKKEMNEILEKIGSLLREEYKVEVKNIKEIKEGQNLNYFIKGYNLSIKENVKLFLKIISKDGYPDVEGLNICYKLLNCKGFEYYNIIHYDNSSFISPYGFIIQEWIDGDMKISNSDINSKVKSNVEIPWLKDYADILKKVHTIKFDYFGDVKGKIKFNSINDYYDNIDEVIRWSFGNVKDEGILLDDLVKSEILDNKFLKYVLNGISNLGREISPKESVLIYGDMFPSNIVYKNYEPRIIDWDECRANWWVYEIARTTYYVENKYIALKFIEYYKPKESLKEIDIGIRIEHIKQHLRKICIMCMNKNKDKNLMDKVENIKKKIIEKLDSRFLCD